MLGKNCDNLINKLDAGASLLLRLSNDVRVTTLVGLDYGTGMSADASLCVGGQEFVLTMDQIDHAVVLLWVWMKILARCARNQNRDSRRLECALLTFY